MGGRWFYLPPSCGPGVATFGDRSSERRAMRQMRRRRGISLSPRRETTGNGEERRSRAISSLRPVKARRSSASGSDRICSHSRVNSRSGIRMARCRRNSRARTTRFASRASSRASRRCMISFARSLICSWSGMGGDARNYES